MAISPDELRDRAKQWIQPISADVPQGAVATTDPRYEFVRNEAAKLDSPTAAGTVQWKVVVEQGGELLEQKSKDFLIGVYVAYGLYIAQGLNGLVTGLALLQGLLDGYWPTMYPDVKRIRGRVNALMWFIERVAILLPTVNVTAADRAPLEGLSIVAKLFAQTVRAKFEGNAPAMGPLLENVERLVMSLPADAPPPPPPAPAPDPAGTPAAATPAPVAAAPAPTAAPPPPPPVATAAVSMPSEPAASLGDLADVANFLRQIGSSLADAGNNLRAANLADPTAYRIRRVGLWIAIAAPPPSQGGKTSVPAVPPAMRAQLEKIAANGNWAALLEEAESGMQQYRLWLDLQRYVAMALGGLGGAHVRAKDAVVTELGTLLRRMPSLVDLNFNDGSAFADAQTKLWIESDVQVASGGGGGGKSGGGAVDDGGLADAVSEAKALVGSGQAADAIALVQAKVSSSGSAGARFRARLALARLCIQGSQMAVAKALYEGLDRDVTTHGLETWEPKLAAEVLEGYVTCARSIAKGGKPLPPETALLYDRLCRIDPAAAAKIGA